MNFTQPVSQRLDGDKAEAVRKNTDQRIRELQQLVSASITVIGDVAMPADGHVFLRHGLGRAPLAVLVSPPRNTAGLTVGLISEARGLIGGVPIDPTQYIVLVAGAFTNAFTVDVVVM